MFDLPVDFFSKIDLKERVLDGKRYHGFDMIRLATGKPERAEYEMVTDIAGNLQGLSFLPDDSQDKLFLRYRDAIEKEESLGKFSFEVEKKADGLTLTLKNSKTKKTVVMSGLESVGKIRPLVDGTLGVIVNGSVLRLNKRLEGVPLKITTPFSLSTMQTLSKVGAADQVVDFASFEYKGDVFFATASSSGRGSGVIYIFNLTKSKLEAVLNSKGVYGNLSGLAVVKDKALLFFRSGGGEALLFSWPFDGN